MKLATTTGDFDGYTTSTYEAIEYVKSAGFKYIDYGFGIDYKYGTGIFSDEADAFIEKIKKHTEELGVKFIQAHSPMGSPLVYDENHLPFVNATKKCIKACSMLGIKNIVVHTGYREGITKKQNFEENKAFYMDLLETAEKCNVNILAENFNIMCVDNVYWIDNASDLKALIDLVNHPLLHACWDTGHGNLQTMSQYDEMKILGKDIYALHVQDNLGDTDTHMAPFFGTMDIASLMKGIKEIRYKGYFTFEACNIFANRPDICAKVSKPSLALRIEAEKFLYQIGKAILTEYNCFEE